MKTIAVIAFCAAPLGGCERSAPSEGSPAATSQPTTWLRGDDETRFGLIEKHLRGFDMAMVETGYRYGELYWAGHDRSWDYARYQLQKIETAIENGIERRPKRAASAAMMEDPIAAIRAAIDAGDARAFAQAFEDLTNSCNACHQAEAVPFMTVNVPTIRLSPIGPKAVAAPPAENEP